MSGVEIAVEDPRQPDIVELLEAHLALMRGISPPGHVHALDLSGLTSPAVTFLAARSGGELLGVGALRELGAGRAEIKSMHTIAQARGRGVGRDLCRHIIDRARAADCTWLGLETGTQLEFEPARSLYESFGFRVCTPFDDYTENPYSTCMALALTPP